MLDELKQWNQLEIDIFSNGFKRVLEQHSNENKWEDKKLQRKHLFKQGFAKCKLLNVQTTGLSRILFIFNGFSANQRFWHNI